MTGHSRLYGLVNRRPRWALTALLTLSGASSWAQSDPCARPIHDGVALRRAGRDAEAMALFEAGLAVCPSARMRVQLAWAEQALGRWLAAAEHLRGALTADDPWVVARRARLVGDLAVIEQHIGRLELVGAEGASVLIDGSPAGVLPWSQPRPMLAGAAQIEVRREGYYAAERRVTIVANQVTREEIALQAIAPARVDPPAAPAARAPAPMVHATIPLAASNEERRSDPRRALAWSFVGGAALGAVVGGVTWALREARAGDFNEAEGGRCFEQHGVALGGASCEGLRREVTELQTASIISFTAGAAFAVASAVLFVTAPRSPRRASVRCAPSPGGVACEGRF